MSITARTKRDWTALAIDRGFEICNLNDHIKKQQAQIEDLKLRLESAVKQWTELEARIAVVKKDTAFYKCRARSGEYPKDGSEPSALEQGRD